MNRISLAVATAATAVLLAACGGSSSSSSTPAASGTSADQLAADPSGALKFTTSSLSAKAGKVTIAFTNSASFAHNVTVATASGAVVGATPTFQGGTKTLSLNLKPGTYTFYCSVSGHRQAGMQGTLVVH